MKYAILALAVFMSFGAELLALRLTGASTALWKLIAAVVCAGLTALCVGWLIMRYATHTIIPSVSFEAQGAAFQLFGMIALGSIIAINALLLGLFLKIIMRSTHTTVDVIVAQAAWFLGLIAASFILMSMRCI